MIKFKDLVPQLNEALPKGGDLDAAMGKARGLMVWQFDKFLQSPTSAHSSRLSRLMKGYEEAAKKLEQYHKQTR